MEKDCDAWCLGTLEDHHLLAGSFVQDLSFWIIELVVFAVAAVCIRHAVRSGRQASPPNWRPLFTMLMVAVFTFAVEYRLSNAGTNNIYSYPETWLLMLLGVPIWIPIGWAWVVYVCMATSSKLKMPWTVAPWLDGFLALSIDFLLDPIADQYGWWTWKAKEGYSMYFDIPLANFVAWFVIVSSFSLFLRYLSTKWFPPGGGLARDLAAPFFALLPAFVAVALFKIFQVQLVAFERATDNPSFWGPIITTVIWACFVWVVVRRAYRCKSDNDFDPVLFYVPTGFYALLLVFLFVKLLDQNATPYPGLALFMPVTALLGCLMFVWPYLGKILSTQAEKGG